MPTNLSSSKLPKKINRDSQAQSSVYQFVKPLFSMFKWGSLAVLIVLIVAIIFGGFWITARYNALGSIKDKISTPPQGSVVYDRNGEEMFRYYDTAQKREIVTLDQIPEVMQLAVISMEDENFYNNEDGIPWTNLVGSALKCLKPGSGECRGGSGLSQQLIKKTITLRTNATFDNKVDELLGAYRFNQEVTKQDVIRLYLNVVSFGRNTYGIQEASKSYFGHNIYDKDKDGNWLLNTPEACFLGSMLTQPENFATGVKDHLNNKDGKEKESKYWTELVNRKNSCIEKLGTKEIKGTGKGGFIKPSEVEKLQKAEVKFEPYKAEEIKYGHIKNFLTDELINKFKDKKEKNPYGFKDETDLLSRGLKIKTTFDAKLQKDIEEIVQRGTKEQIVPNGGNNAAAIVLDGPTGQIVAMVGSADFNDKKIDGQVNIVTAPRQPGSSIKPYVYASAYQNGFNPGTVLLDTPIDFGKFEPLNFDKKFYGSISGREAMQNSLNIATVKALYLSATPSNYPNGQSGLNNFKDFTEKTGLNFPYFDQGICGVATAIGGCEVKMVDHATGLNTLLQEGKKSTATPFLEISTKEKDFITGKESTQDLYNLVTNSPNNPYPQEGNAIEPTVARQIANVMSDTASRYPSVWGSTAQYLTLPDWDGVGGIAAKTGTTNDVKDMWVVGGSPYYTVLVWGGNTDNKPMNQKASSSGVTGRIWQEIMKRLHTGKDKKGFSKEGLVPTGLNPATGLLQEGGKTELLTNKQIEKLKEIQTKINAGQVDYNNGSIFSNRTSVFSSKIKINKIDKKLIPNNDQGKAWPPQLTDEIFCQVSISEFPLADNWRKGSGGTNRDCPSETSPLDANATKMNFEINFSSGQKAPDSLSIFIKPPIPETKIKSIEIKIGGQYTGSVQDTNNIQQDVKGLNGIKDVEITVRDELGQETKVGYPAIVFGDGNISVTPNSVLDCGINGGTVTLGQNCPTSVVPTSQAPILLQIKP